MIGGIKMEFIEKLKYLSELHHEVYSSTGFISCSFDDVEKRHLINLDEQEFLNIAKSLNFKLYDIIKEDFDRTFRYKYSFIYKDMEFFVITNIESLRDLEEKYAKNK